jgi:hypothetical protein
VAFNAETYRMNRHRKEAFENLAKARDIKARMAAGTAFDWEAPRIETFAKLARSSHRLYISARHIRDISRSMKALR